MLQTQCKAFVFVCSIQNAKTYIFTRFVFVLVANEIHCQFNQLIALCIPLCFLCLFAVIVCLSVDLSVCLFDFCLSALLSLFASIDYIEQVTTLHWRK